MVLFVLGFLVTRNPNYPLDWTEQDAHTTTHVNDKVSLLLEHTNTKTTRKQPRKQSLPSQDVMILSTLYTIQNVSLTDTYFPLYTQYQNKLTTNR